jgi:hypothetical protein
MNENYIRDYFMEVNYVNNKLNVPCPLVVFEDNAENVNQAILHELRQEFEMVPLYYITREQIIKIYDFIKSYLSSHCKKIFMKLYPNKNVNYGNVFNRIFLVALLFGADYIHRRDSDILIDTDIYGEKVYPILNEVKYLNHIKNNKLVHIVGGGYKGKYDLDVDSFIDDNDYTLLRELFLCMSIPAEHHDAIINEEILGNNKLFEQDYILFDSRDYPECGNIALYNLHKYFPAPTQDFILGSDYFFIDVAVHSKLNVTYHNRAVIHSYTSDRKNDWDKIFRYWKGFMMLIDSQIYYRNFYEKYLDLQDYNDRNFNKYIPDMIYHMKKFLEDFEENYYTVRRAKYLKCISILSLSKDETLREVAVKLQSEIILQEIMNVTIEAVREHIKLIEAWKEITNVCSQNKDNFIVKKILQEAYVK